MIRLSSIIILMSLSCITLAQSVTIGNQVWMKRNLDVSTFRNGDPIPQATTDREWKIAAKKKKPAWCYYNNDPANGTKYGKLYNWYAVTDSRGLAPKGWHVPSDEEWDVLVSYLGGSADANRKMKTTTGWGEGGQGTNESGFTGLPGGSRLSNGTFYRIGINGFWWRSTAYFDNYAWFHYLFSKRDYAFIDYYCDKGEGLSVRCIKD